MDKAMTPRFIQFFNFVFHNKVVTEFGHCFVKVVLYDSQVTKHIQEIHDVH